MSLLDLIQSFHKIKVHKSFPVALFFIQIEYIFGKISSKDTNFCLWVYIDIFAIELVSLVTGLKQLGVEVPQHRGSRGTLALTVYGDVLTEISYILGLNLGYDDRTL